MAYLRNILIVIALWTGIFTAAVGDSNVDAANIIPTIQALIQQGQYIQAHDLALSQETAEGYALASESLARRVFLGETEKPKRAAKQARELAQRALELDPHHQKSHLQYVIMDGFIARKTGRFSAWMNKLPQKSYDNITAYRKAYPDDERGDALLGAWHLGVARRTGNENAQKWFDASIEQGVQSFEKTLLKSPDDVVILLNYAFGLIVLSEDGFGDRDKITSLLEHLQNMTAIDDLERKLILRARAALSMTEDSQRLNEYAQAFLDGVVPE